MATEASCAISDVIVGAELVDCSPVDAPEIQSQVCRAIPDAPTPVQRAADSTLGQTGADPPPHEG